MIEHRAALERPTLIVALHSCTPVFKGVFRPWEIGIIWGSDDRLARLLLAIVGTEPGLTVGLNQPYVVDPVNDYTLPVHGEAGGLAHVEIELRQDLIGEAAGRAAWAERVASWLARLAERAGAEGLTL